MGKTSNFIELAASLGVEVVIAAIGFGLLYRLYGRFFAVPSRQKVSAYQQGVLLRDGKLPKLLMPGFYWITPKYTFLLCDMRPRPFQIPAQELVARDGTGLRISLGGECRIVDATRFVTESSDTFGAFMLDVRQALRASVEEFNGEAVISGCGLVTTRMKELLEPRAAQLGLELIKLDTWEALPVRWLRNS